jgi:hypothetical protein
MEKKGKHRKSCPILGKEIKANLKRISLLKISLLMRFSSKYDFFYIYFNKESQKI